MNWQVYLGLFFVCSTIGNLLRRNFAKTTLHHSSMLSFVIHCAVVLPLGILWALTQRVVLNNLTPAFLMYAVLAGLAISIFSICAFQSQKTVDASQFAIISNINAPFVALLSVLFLSEKLGPYQLVGMILILCGVSLVSGVKRGSNSAQKSHLWLAVVAALTAGLAIIFERFAIKATSIAVYFVVGGLMQALVLALLSRRHLSKIRHISRTEMKLIGLMGCARFSSGIMFLTAVKSASNLSLVTTASSFRTVVICIAGYVFLHERDRLWQKIVGSLIATVGLFLM